jgi:hypothetical protein
VVVHPFICLGKPYRVVCHCVIGQGELEISKTDLKKKSGDLKESLTALKSHVESLVIRSLSDRVLVIWMLTSK